MSKASNPGNHYFLYLNFVFRIYLYFVAYYLVLIHYLFGSHTVTF